MTKRPVLSSSRSAAPLNLIIDSGAFSAWRLGTPIDVVEYTDWLIDNPWIETYVALDVINPQYPEDAARESLGNLHYMMKRGLKPIPVYHAGERAQWLLEMLRTGCNYIGLSASSIVARGGMADWYASAWRELVDPDGYPIVKVHAFGESSVPLLSMFPWYSADSLSWLYQSQMMPVLHLPGGGKVSMRSDRASPWQMQDLHGLDKLDETELLEILDKMGVSIASLREGDTATTTTLRAYFCCLRYMKVEQRSNRILPKRFLRSGFFSGEAWKDKSAIDMPDGTHLHLALGGPPVAPPCVARAGHKHILVSYFTMKTSKVHSRLREYINDPMRVCSEPGPSQKYYQILQEHVR